MLGAVDDQIGASKETRMRIALAGCAVAVLSWAAGSAVVDTASATAIVQTQRIVIRPVTSAGRAAAGYAVARQRNVSADCSFAEPSPVAVDRNIVLCSPDYLYLPACWKSATFHYVLCIRDARSKDLAKVRHLGPVAQTTPRAVLAPLDMRLGDGKYCKLRVGGAGPGLQGHPRWDAFYYCSGRTAVWAPLNATNWGVNRSHRIWTVQIAPDSGNGRLSTHRVLRAWFVGTRT